MESENRTCPVLICSGYDDIKEILKTPLFLEPFLIEGVNRLIDSPLQTAYCLEIRIHNEETAMWITLQREEASQKLREIIKRKESEEDYEECHSLMKIINRL